MSIEKKGVLIGALIITVGVFPALALADSDGLGSDLQVSGGIHVESDEGMHTSLGATTSVHAESSDNGQDGGEKRDVTESHSTMTNVPHEDMNAGHDNIGGDTNGDDNDIEIDHDGAEHATSTIDSDTKVKTRAHLRSFLNHLVKEDEHIEDVNVTSNDMETHYETDAKLLGFIPSKLTADVSVANDGTVTVTFPWYALFFAHGEGLQQRLQATASSSAVVSGSTTLTASAQAHLLDGIFAALRNSQN